MERFTGPVRFRFKGDPELARQYIGIGRKLLGGVIEQMKFGRLPELTRSVRLQDGTVINLRSGYNENIIEIFREEERVPVEIVLGGDFVTIPASEEAPQGWGEPFFDGEGDPINPPLGTPGGGFPQTVLAWIEEGAEWRSRRYPQYEDKWPAGVEYGNNSWAGLTDSFGPVALSWKSEQRYRDWGFLFKSQVIYYDGFQLCNAKQYVIGAAVVGTNLVVLSATREAVGRTATWHYRPFKPGGYDNDDDYDATTNPDGWRECLGDSQENFAREDARQPLVFTPDGSKAAGSFVEARANYGSDKDQIFNIKVIRYSFASSVGQVIVTKSSELDPYATNYQTYPSFFSHKYFGPPPAQGEVDQGTTPQAVFYAPVYSEYDANGNLVECSMVSGAGTIYKEDQVPTQNIGVDISDDDNRTLMQFGNNQLEAYFYDFYRNAFDGVVQEFRVTDRQYAIIDGNLSLGYFLLLTRTEAPVFGSFTTTISLVGPGINVELFSTPNLLSYPLEPMGINVYNPAHGGLDPDFEDSEVYGTDPMNKDLGKNVGLPEGVDENFEHYFAAHRTAYNQIIVTAWVRWDRGTEILFGAYDFITDGNLPALTQVQGTNQRHQNTGVI